MAVNPSDIPPPPRLPRRGAVGVPARPARCQLTTSPSPRPLTSQGSPTWASVVRGEACPSVEKATCPRSQPAVTAADLSALYQRCMASGLKARVVISHAAGCQIFTVSCNIPFPAVTKTVTGRCRRRRRRRRAATVAGEEPANVSPHVAVAGLSPLPVPSSPAPSPPPSTPPTIPSPEIQPPPAKKSR